MCKNTGHLYLGETNLSLICYNQNGKIAIYIPSLLCYNQNGKIAIYIPSLFCFNLSAQAPLSVYHVPCYIAVAKLVEIISLKMRRLYQWV